MVAMVEVEIDGQKVEMAPGSMVFQAATKLGIYIPHFCYHKKLSIAANCRMCLVDVEKAPKALPACATPVAPGMKIATASEKAKKAQQAVMEFLLINHPLDCPICDQGGECQLQDLAVGYGGSGSRYREEKRVVFHKSMGPLISAEEMSRCIHCTRCVRFGQEVAGVMELGMNHRGQHSEITSFLGRSVDSELSGNMIDLCPVGALTSKPFRYAARTWELSRRRSIAMHDALGSNTVVQVKHDKVLRVVPLENEAINECWLSDRDRFSYEALNSEDRLSAPMLKRDGVWHEVDWATAIAYAAHALEGVKAQHAAQAIGILAAANSSMEEHFMLAAIAQGLGGAAIDSRLRQIDFSVDAGLSGAPWLGMAIEEVNHLQRLLLIGSFLRKDHPLIAARVRAAVKQGLVVSEVHAVGDDLLMPIANRALLSPSRWPQFLALVLKQLRSQLALEAASMPAVAPDMKDWVDSMALLASPEDLQLAKAMAQSMQSGERKAIWLGSSVRSHAQYGQIHALAQAIAQHCGARLGVLVEAANAVGAWQLGLHALGSQRSNAQQMINEPRKAYIVYQNEPEYDHAQADSSLEALASAETVIVMSAYRSEAMMQYADCLLPIASFTETAGTVVNMEGRRQSYSAVVKPLGQSRPGWKVLRVLADLLKIPSLEFETIEDLRSSAFAKADACALSNHLSHVRGLFDDKPITQDRAPLERLAEVPIYSCDAIVRRAPSLQATADAHMPALRMHPDTLRALLPSAMAKAQEPGAFAAGAVVEVCIADHKVVLNAKSDASTARGVLRMPMALDETRALPFTEAPISLRVIGPLSRRTTPGQSAGSASQASGAASAEHGQVVSSAEAGVA